MTRPYCTLRTSAVALSLTAVLAQPTPEECTLVCAIPTAPCAFYSEQDLDRFADDPHTVDDTPFDWHTIPTVNGMHCVCPHGVTGVRCEVPFETCDGSTHPCYFGGSCVPGLLDTFGNDQLFCNCKNAMDENGIHRVGKYCETAETNYCPEDDTGMFYCVHGGICNPDFPASGEPCVCQAEYFGEHCEYKRGTVPENLVCDLNCQNGGQCVLGEAPVEQLANSYPYFSNNNSTAVVDHKHCSCPEGYDGDLCEVRRTPCGNDFCFHGGKCVERVVDGTMLYHCDCNEASTASNSYAGRFCQYKATSYCAKSSDLNEHLFCTNGGICREDPKQGCNCSDHYEGFSCEFVRVDPAADTSSVPEFLQPGRPIVDPAESYACDLNCANGGVCRNGLKDLGYLENITAPHLNDTDENFKHCVCPDGWTGLLCDHEINICGEGEHVCLHGSQCVKNGDKHACDCSTATSNLAENFAGNYCEHPVDQICTDTPPGPAQPLLFCVNGGTCKQIVPNGSAHPGCICESGFSGPHCELSHTTEPPFHMFDETLAPQFTAAPVAETEQADSNNDNGAAAGKVVIALFVGMAVLVGAYFFFSASTKRKRRHDDNLTQNLRWASSYKDTPADRNLHNISPRSTASGNLYEDYPVSAHVSSTDPFATHLAHIQNDPGEESSPQVYIGPPRDEDGHELHNVEIL